MQLESTDKNMKSYTAKMIENSENVLRNEMSLLNTRINDLRIENHKTIFELDKQCKQISNEYDRIQEIKKEINTDFSGSVDNMKNMHKETTDAFELYKEDFNKIKARFIDLSDFVKDIRFKKNLQVDVDKKEIKNLSESLSFRHPHRSQTLKILKPLNDFEAESEVKKYIKGIKDPKKKISKVFEHLEELEDSCEEKDLKANTIQTSKDLPISKRLSSMDLKVKSTDSRKSTMQLIANVSRKNTNNSKIEVKASDDKDDRSYKCNTVEVKSIDMRNKLLNSRVDIGKVSKDLRNENDFKLDGNDESAEPVLRSSILNRYDDREDYDLIDPSPITRIDNDLAASHDNFQPKSNIMNLFKQEFEEPGFKNDVTRRISETEKRLLEIEANAKKKLEELVSKVKVYIPINFNSYVKQQDGKANTAYDNSEQNYCVNVLDANSLLQNPSTGFRGDTNKTAFRSKSKPTQPEVNQRRTQ